MTEVTSESVRKYAGIYIGNVSIGSTTSAVCSLDDIQKILHHMYHDFIKAGGYYPHRQRMIAFSALELKLLQTESVTSGTAEPAYLYGAMQYWDALILRTFKSTGKKIYGSFESLHSARVVQSEKPTNLFLVKDRLLNLKHVHVPLLVFTYTSHNKKYIMCHMIACQSPEQALEMASIISDNRRAYSEDFGTLQVEDDTLFVPTKSNYENWRLTDYGWRLTHTKYPEVSPHLTCSDREAQMHISPPTTIDSRLKLTKNNQLKASNVIRLSDKDFMYKGANIMQSQSSPSGPSSRYRYDGKIKRFDSDCSDMSFTPDIIKNCDNSRLAVSKLRSSSESDDKYEHRWNQVIVQKQHKPANSPRAEEKPVEQTRFQPTVYKRGVTASKSMQETSSSGPPESASNASDDKHDKPEKHIPNYMRNGVKVLPTIRALPNKQNKSTGIEIENRFEQPVVSSQFRSKSAHNLTELPDRDENFNKANYDTGFGSIDRRDKARKRGGPYGSQDMNFSSKKEAEIDSALSASVHQLTIDESEYDESEVDFEQSLGYFP